MSGAAPRHRAPRVVGLVLACLLALHAARGALGLSGPPVDRLVDDLVYNAVLLGSAAMCLWRAAAVRRHRAAWAALGAAVLLWAAGEVLWSAALDASSPAPSAADGLWLAFYPLACLGVALLVRDRIRGVGPGAWLDGGIAALGAAAVGAALLLPSVRAAAQGDGPEVAVNLAYPLGDLVLLGIAVGIVSFSGRRPSRVGIAVASALALSAVADGLYLYRAASDTYVEGGLLDTLWPASALLLALAAWLDAPGPAAPPVHVGLRGLAPAAAAALAAIGVVTVDHVTRLDGVAVGLAAATLGAVLARAALALREAERALGRLGRQALADPLTGLGNRRGLVQRLDAIGARRAGGEQRWLLVILDLDGFKAYNDAFGHPAGDALLRRLGTRLAGVAGPAGRAYRLGGDEFCLLAPAPAEAEPLLAAAAAALHERGEGFEVRASLGAVLLPGEAAGASEALRLADRRLYEDKRARRPALEGQAERALVQALSEREPDLRRNHGDVVALAVALARRLGLREADVHEIGRAAALHDVGKLAVPDAILRKPGPLTEDERRLVDRHTIIGERILASTPDLVGVSRLVRHSHERWDGAGYPDGLAGEAIPLGARIVAVCDAFDAMANGRPYRRAMDAGAALAELRRCAGSQFDPAVVSALAQEVAEPHDGCAEGTDSRVDGADRPATSRSPGFAPSPRRSPSAGSR